MRILAFLDSQKLTRLRRCGMAATEVTAAQTWAAFEATLRSGPFDVLVVDPLAGSRGG